MGLPWLARAWSLPLALVLVSALALSGCLFDEDFQVAQKPIVSDTATNTSTTSGAMAAGGNSSSASLPDTTAFGGQSAYVTHNDIEAAAGGTKPVTPTVSANGGGATASTPSWRSMAAPPLDFVARERAAVAMFEGKVFIFGGADNFGTSLDTGAIYDPKADTWEVMSVDEDTPEPREAAAAIYVSGHIYVWGGKSYYPPTRSYRALPNGAAYDPKLRTWTKIQNGWMDRAGPTAATDGTRAAFWGGYNTASQSLAGGEIFNALLGKWEWMSSNGLPDRTTGETVVATDSAIWVYGGLIDGGGATDAAHRYDMKTNQWSSLGAGPNARWGSFGAFDGTHFYVWGGRDTQSVRNDGRLFARSWIELQSANPPEGRWLERQTTGWAVALATDDLLFLGGYDANSQIQIDGLRYQRHSGTWSRVAHWPSNEEHCGAVGIWTGSEFILFGGRNGNRMTSTGERWKL